MMDFSATPHTSLSCCWSVWWPDFGAWAPSAAAAWPNSWPWWVAARWGSWHTSSASGWPDPQAGRRRTSGGCRGCAERRSRRWAGASHCGRRWRSHGRESCLFGRRSGGKGPGVAHLLDIKLLKTFLFIVVNSIWGSLIWFLCLLVTQFTNRITSWSHHVDQCLERFTIHIIS